MFVAISEAMIVKIGMWGLLPLFLEFLFFIMWDISKKTNAGKAGTFWIFVALGAGFIGFLLKLIIEWALKTWFIK